MDSRAPRRNARRRGSRESSLPTKPGWESGEERRAIESQRPRGNRARRDQTVASQTVTPRRRVSEMLREENQRIKQLFLTKEGEFIKVSLLNRSK